jgi:ankyrin repeat protein
MNDHGSGARCQLPHMKREIAASDVTLGFGWECTGGTGGDMFTVLQNATVRGDVAELRRLVAAGADVNELATSGLAVGLRPLHLAAGELGNIETVKVLMELGADKDGAGGRGARPLHMAAATGQIETVKLLVVRGAVLDTRDENDNTPLHQASGMGQVETVKLLIQFGADKNAIADNGSRPLHVAVSHGHMETARMLVHLGADIEAPADGGVRPLHSAAINGHLEVVRLLAQLGAEMGVVARLPQFAGGFTPLQMSVRFGHHHVARVLGELERSASAPRGGAQSRSTAATATVTQTGGCAACGGGSVPSGAAFKRCSRCKTVKYCSALCQRTHWSVHKASCAAAPGDPAQEGDPSSAQGASGSIEPSASTPAAATSKTTQQASERADRMATELIEEVECEQAALAAQKMQKGKGKAKGGGGGGPSKAAAAAGSSGQAGSSQRSSRPSATTARIIERSTEEPAGSPPVARSSLHVPTAEMVRAMSVKELKAHLTRLHTDHSKCVEKSELVALLCAVSLAAAGQPPVARSCGASSSSTAAGVEEAVQVAVPTVEEAHAMSVRQLETQLAAAGVDYSAALEKSELVEMLLSQATLKSLS